jgi:maleate isomerase
MLQFPDRISFTIKAIPGETAMLDAVKAVATAPTGQSPIRPSEMSQWTKKFGYVIPSWNTVVEYETTRMLPSGVSAHFSRIEHTEDSAAQLVYMSEQFPSHVKLLMHANLDAICYACTGATFLKGRAKDVEYLEGMVTLARRPIVSMAGSLVDAAKHLNVSRIAVGAPYEDWLMKLLVAYLEDSGFKITNAIGLGQQANFFHTPDAAVELANRVWTSDADGLILSCANFRTLEVVGNIEQRLGKPLITSNQAALWNLLSKSNWRGSVPGAGMLLKSLALPG